MLIGLPRDLYRPVGLGILLTFVSSFGQNFFLAIFGGAFRGAFDLGNGQFGALYSGVTIASAVALVWLGRGVDRWPMPLVGAVTVSALAGAALLLAASQHVVSLFVALLGVRLFGQGMAVQLSVTAVTRSAAVGARGRALSLSTVGNPVGEATLPLAAVAAMGWLGWRGVWSAIAAVLVLVALPALLALSRSRRPSRSEAGAGEIEARHAALRTVSEGDPDGASQGTSERPAPRSDAVPDRSAWTVGEALRHPLFYLLVPGLLAPNVLNTSIFFHQVALGQAKGWNPAWFVAAYPVASLANIGATLAVGWLIDRTGSLRVLPFALAPQLLAVAALAATDRPAGIAAYMALAGAAMGVALPLQGTILAEVYGTRHFGAIRAVVSACNVLLCALSPALIGWLVDAGVGFDAQFVAMAVYLLLCAALVPFGRSIARDVVPRAGAA